jgi:hypothetical protein
MDFESYKQNLELAVNEMQNIEMAAQSSRKDAIRHIIETHFEALKTNTILHSDIIGLIFKQKLLSFAKESISFKVVYDLLDLALECSHQGFMHYYL